MLAIDKLRPPNQIDMKRMIPGDVAIFKMTANTAVSSVQSKIGGIFRQQTLFLLDPKTAQTQKVFLVECVWAALKNES